MGKEGYFGLVVAGVVLQMMYPVLSPSVGWPIVAILTLLAIVLFVMGIKKKENRESLVLSVTEYAIGIAGYDEYPDRPVGAHILCLWVVISPASRLDRLDLQVGSALPIPTISWPRRMETAFRVYFDVSEWRYKKVIQTELVAKASSKSYSSGLKPINFDVEPFGRHPFKYS